MNRDGRADIIVGAGSGGTPDVKIISGLDGTTTLANFFAFASNFTGGVTVGGGDVNNDGFADIIAGAASGADTVKVFSGKDLSVWDSFAAFGSSAMGVFVGSGDVNGDGFAGEDSGESSIVKAFDGQTLAALSSFQPNGPSDTKGVFVAAIPEPATWATMLTGLGLLGFSIVHGKRGPGAC